MKTTNWLMIILLLGALAPVGCGKQKPPVAAQPGVRIDLPKLREAFTTASPELQRMVSDAAMGVRYRDYSSVLAALDKLANAPGVTEPQKKIVGEVTEQVKQVASKAAAPPAK